MSHPFDLAAPGYDRTFTRTRLGHRLREAVWRQLPSAFAPGDHILELGCGTGEDAIWLAQRGVRVTATDASPQMLEVARAKAEAAGLAERLTFARLDLCEQDGRRSAASGLAPSSPYDGALADFGPLNCLPDRRALAQGLARLIRPTGRVVLVTMGPLCPWEVIWHLAHGQWRAAWRRFHPGVMAQVAPGAAPVRVWYPSPRRLQREFATHFRQITVVGIGVLLPPSYLGHLVEHRPGLCAALAAIERRLGHTFPWTWLNDHYLTLLERR